MELKDIKLAITSTSFSQNKQLIDIIKFFFKNIKINEEWKKFTKSELTEFLQWYDAIIVGLDEIDKYQLKKLKKLKYISKYGVWLDNIDQMICKKKGIKIGWKGGVNRLEVAEHTLWLIIGLMRKISENNCIIKNKWRKKNGGRSLFNKTVGIIWLGNVWKELVLLLKPFNCNILANDITDISRFCKKNNIKESSKEYIYKNADIISIHTNLTKETQYMVTKKELSKMKKTSILINTARWWIINEKDLELALKNNIIEWSAFDVFGKEPCVNRWLLELKNFIATPHTAWNAKEAIKKMWLNAIYNLIKIIINEDNEIIEQFKKTYFI